MFKCLRGSSPTKRSIQLSRARMDRRVSLGNTGGGNQILGQPWPLEGGGGLQSVWGSGCMCRYQDRCPQGPCLSRLLSAPGFLDG